MKTFIKIFAVAIAFVLMMSVAVFAEGEPTFTITNEVVDEDAGIYSFQVSAEANPGVKIFSILFSYNSDVVIPFDANYLEGSFDFTDTENNETADINGNGVYFRDSNGFCFDISSKLELQATLYEIDEENNRVGVYPTLMTTSNLKAHKSGVIFDYYYTIADGKTIDDIDFALETASTAFTNIANTSNKGSATHIYASVTDGTEYTGSKGEIVVDAFFDEGEPTVSTISVAAGSTVYFVDGTAMLFNEDTEVEVPAEAGLIYVNTGYDAHTVYAVDAEGVPTKVTGLDNAILGSAGANIRTSGVQGIRFRASVSNTAKDLGLATSEYEIAEYGFIVTAETNKTGFDSNSDFLGMNLVEAGKAKKGVAYNKADGTDIVFAEETDSTIFTNVVKNIPLTKSALQANIVSRPYYIVTDGATETVLYGELTKKSVYGVAVAIKEAAGADYTDNKDYIDSIISIVEDTQVAELTTEIAIDVTKLYE